MEGAQPVTIVYARPTTSVRPNFKGDTAKFLGIAQIIFGVAMIVLQVVSIIFYAGLFFVGHGIWCGIIVSLQLSFLILHNATSL